MSSKFHGTGVALVTPFTSNKEVDTTGLKNLVEHCINGGVEYLVVLGTTGESATLKKDEKKLVIQTVIDANAGRLPLVLGIGGNDTMEVIETIKNTDLSAFDAILSVSPFYNKPTQEGIYQHYKAIASSTEKDIILYNVPGRTSSNMAAATTLRLANDFKNIIAIKEASGNMEQIMEIIKDRPTGFLVISGDDNLTLPMIALGGEGVISVSGQGFPEVFTPMVRTAIAGDIVGARANHYELVTITQMLFAEGNPGGIKAVLQARGVCGAHMRLPLWPISDGLRQRIEAETARILGN